MCSIFQEPTSDVLSLIPCRRHLAGLLKEHSLVEGGDLQVATWIKDEGFDTTIPSVMQVQHPNFMHMLVWDLNGGLPLCKSMSIMLHAVHVLLMLHYFAEAANFDRPWHESIKCHKWVHATCMLTCRRLDSA